VSCLTALLLPRRWCEARVYQAHLVSGIATPNPMAGTAPLDVLPLWALFLGLVLANLLADEGGFRVGYFRARREHKEGDATVGAIVAAELGLLAFLLAFSFNLAASRFDARRHTLVDEANAIGTTFLRAAMLPEAQGGPVRQLLRDYADMRLAPTRGAPIDEVLRRSEEIHQRLWAEAIVAAEHDPRSLPTSLFIQSLNNVIDMHATRVLAVLRSRLPLPVWTILIAVSLLSFFTMGYQAGLTRASRSPAVVVLALTFGAVIWLIANLDRPGEGFLRVNQEPMIDVRRMMNTAP